MKPVNNVIESIQKRYSVRNYSSRVIEQEKMQQIMEYISINRKGPFGSNVRFQIVDGSAYDKDELKKLGAYGTIKGPRLFIAGAVNRNTYAMEDFGYCMEKNILMATGLGLGTCWLGASFNRSGFAEKMKISDNEIIAAVTPVGYAGEKNTFKGQALSLIMRSGKRKNPRDLFFYNNIDNPLDLNECGLFATVLECVRLSPSAGNMQPWRIIKNDNAYHFYQKENTTYNNYCNKRYEGAKLQNIDMGIAMAHFEMAAAELEIFGEWKISEPAPAKDELKYIASWHDI